MQEKIKNIGEKIETSFDRLLKSFERSPIKSTLKALVMIWALKILYNWITRDQ